MKLSIIYLCLSLAAALQAAPRSSTNYSIPTDTTSAGGARATSASYTSESSSGSIVGIASVASLSETLKSGYIGQLYEVSAVQVSATPATVNEGTTRQLAATAALDDATTTLLGMDASWTILSGPLTGISSSGLTTAGNVYQNTSATVRGSYRGVVGTVGLTVVNMGTDDFGIYASDGIPDTWQVQFFGENNPLAAPVGDATYTGQNNLFKYTAGLNPIDPASRFQVSVGNVPGQPTQHTLTFSPRLTDRTYTVEYSTMLTTWQTLTSATLLDNGLTRMVTDTDATATRKFYRVVVSFP